MSKKILCLLLLAVMLLPMLAACNDTQEPTGTVAPETQTGTQTSEPTGETATPTPEPTPLPSSSTLVGTKHVPPIDSQGSIGSCSSQSVTYTQFTIAVSQYMNNVLKNESWNPSSGNKAYIFSPKSTFVYSGAGTQYQYDILTDSGALPLTMSTFKKSGEASINDDPLSRAWDTAKGYMAHALKYRLSGYKEIEFDAFNYDFTTDVGKAHLDRVKRALCDGNAVSVCGWSSYWQYSKVEEPGDLAKVGDGVIWAGWKRTEGDQGDGNHAITIVGYDDNITMTIAGARMQGAFLIANSWGVGYQNDGYVWMMYDSFNKKSGHAALAEEGFYSSRPSFYSTSESLAKVKQTYTTKDNTQLVYTKTGEKKTVEGKEYDVYTIKDAVYSKYLGYNPTNQMVWKEAEDTTCSWVIIPYEDYSKWNGFEFTAEGKFNEVSYKGSYLICSAEKYQDLSSACFIEIAASSGSASGREVSLGVVKGNTIDRFASYVYTYKANSDTFTCALRAYHVSNLVEYERTGTLYRTSFVYWDKDVLINEPNLIVEVELDAVKRESISISLFRSDADGNAVTRLPQIIDNNLKSTTAMASPTGDTRFDGKESDGTYCKGYVAFGFNDLAKLSESYNYENLLWGVTVKGNILGVKVRGLRLMDLAGNVLSQIKVNEEYCQIGKGEERSFYFDMGGELKSYAANPGQNSLLYNVGAGKHLNKKSALLSLGDEKQSDAVLSFTQVEDGSYQLWNDEKWLLDIKGKEIKEGAMVKLNVINEERKTQNWIVESIEGNAFIIKLAADPNYMVSYNPAKNELFLTTKKDDNGYYKWQALSDRVDEFAVKANATDSKIEISGVVPEGYTSGNVEIKVTNNDGTYNGAAISVTPKDGAFTTSIDKLPAGTYIFTAIYNGSPHGFQYIYTVK